MLQLHGEKKNANECCSERYTFIIAEGKRFSGHLDPFGDEKSPLLGMRVVQNLLRHEIAHLRRGGREKERERERREGADRTVDDSRHKVPLGR